MPNIEWTEDDAVDPYPAIIEAMGKIYLYATTCGSIGVGPSDEEYVEGESHSELFTIRKTFEAVVSTLVALDPDSIKVFVESAQYK